MYKVEWNKEHTWKILKFYKEGKINKIQFEGVWYKPVVNTNSYERDEFGNRYIACRVNTTVPRRNSTKPCTK